MSANPIRIDLDLIRTNGGTQSRAFLNQETINEYADLINKNDSWKSIFPPIIVFYDGSYYWLADGFHRLEAAKKSGLKNIHCIVSQGTQRDAILFSVGANAEHGLPRSSADKRRAVETMLNDNEWSNWSDNQIAKQCKVSQPFVSAVRKELQGDNMPSTRRTQRNGKSVTINTNNIGKSQPTQQTQEADKDPNTKKMFESPQDTNTQQDANTQQDTNNNASYNVISKEQEITVELKELSIELYSEQQEIEDLKNQKSALNEEIASLRFQKEQLEKQLTDANNKIATLESSKDKAYKELAELSIKNDKQAAELEVRQKMINEFSNRSTEANEKVTKLTETNNQLFSNNVDLEEQVNDLENEVKELKNELHKKNLEIITVNQERYKLESQIKKAAIKPANSKKAEEMLNSIQSIIESALEKGKEKGEGIRIGRRNSIELLDAIKQARGVE